jgi:hypothetical protein
VSDLSDAYKAALKRAEEAYAEAAKKVRSGSTPEAVAALKVASEALKAVHLAVLRMAEAGLLGKAE